MKTTIRSVLVLVFALALSTGSAQIAQKIGENPYTIETSAAFEMQSSSKGFLLPRMTTAQRDAIVSPVAGLNIYNLDKNCMEWYNGTLWYNGCGDNVFPSTNGTAVVTSYDCSTGSSGTLEVGKAASGVSQTITATVSTIGNYSISTAAVNGIIFSGSGTFSGTGSQSVVLTASGTPAAAGSYSHVLNTSPGCSFSRTAALGQVGGNAICDGSRSTTVVEVTGAAGKIWMDRNLGASRVAEAFDDYEAYGCLYQWGRGNDGHASITWTSSTGGSAVNGSTSTPSTSNSPGHALFISSTSSPYDWRSGQNDALWQGVSKTNNPCPSGFRLPTDAEWNAEISSSGIRNSATANSSVLKLVVAGGRNYNKASLNDMGSGGYYWSAEVNNTNAFFRYFGSSGTNSSSFKRANGCSVRCLKD